MNVPNDALGGRDEGRAPVLAERTRNQIERDGDKGGHVDGDLMIHLDRFLPKLFRPRLDLLTFVIFAEEVVSLPTANASLIDRIVRDAIDQEAEIEERSHVRSISGRRVTNAFGEALSNLKGALPTQHVIVTNLEIVPELCFESTVQQVKGPFGV
jgi:hypothetical protein